MGLREKWINDTNKRHQQTTPTIGIIQCYNEHVSLLHCAPFARSSPHLSSEMPSTKGIRIVFRIDFSPGSGWIIITHTKPINRFNFPPEHYNGMRIKYTMPDNKKPIFVLFSFVSVYLSFLFIVLYHSIVLNL